MELERAKTAAAKYLRQTEADSIFLVVVGFLRKSGLRFYQLWLNCIVCERFQHELTQLPLRLLKAYIVFKKING